MQKLQQIRERLLKEGLIKSDNRRELPALPRRVGIVTGAGTALPRYVKAGARTLSACRNRSRPAQVQG
ncbi:MAG: hypothetical protein U1F16_16105 [Turneriella sp.]